MRDMHEGGLIALDSLAIVSAATAVPYAIPPLQAGLAHLIDHQVYYDRKTRTWASEAHPAFAAWRAAAANLEKRSLPGGYARQRYFQSVHELWARSYAQTVLLRSDDCDLLRRLEKLQAEDDAHVWPAEQFVPVALEVELVFERLGLRQLRLPLAA